MLVGIDTKGILTGLVVGEHHEPYGDFSIDRPEFAGAVQGQGRARPVQARRRRRCRVPRDDHDVDRGARPCVTASRPVARSLLAPPAEAANSPTIVWRCRRRRRAVRLAVRRVWPSRRRRARRPDPAAARRFRQTSLLPGSRPASLPTGWNFDEDEEEERRRGPTMCARRRSTSGWSAFSVLAFVSFFRKSVALKYVTFVAAVGYSASRRAS